MTCPKQALGQGQCPVDIRRRIMPAPAGTSTPQPGGILDAIDMDLPVCSQTSMRSLLNGTDDCLDEVIMTGDFEFDVLKPGDHVVDNV